MIYTAPDGTVLKSDPNKTVTHSLKVEGIAEGIYESFETTSSATPIGIQQIKIKKTVVGNNMTIEITESTDQELQDYINQIKQEQYGS